MLVALVTSGWQAFAQTSAGLKGVVTDSSGAVVPAAEIVVTNLDNGAKRQTVTNETGDYDIPLLPSGRYTIAGRKPGFKQAIREDVRLELNQIAQIDFTLTAGEVSETVEVRSSAPLLESNTSSVGHVIETKAVSDLPLNGRNFAQLAILGPGVTGVGYSASGTIGSGTRPDDMRPGTELFSNGNREQSNNFMLDGVDNNFRRNGLITLRPSVEAVLEFKIQTNLFQAEQGRNPGATINVITKSGSNSFRGSAYEFFRNSRLDARNFFAKPGSPKAQYQQNQFGASLGGPIRHDKLFFFADYEGFRKRQGTFASVNTVPTVAMRGGDFSGVRAIYDPFSVTPAPGTASGYSRTPFPGSVIPAARFDAVTSRLIQAYPLPDTTALANNQVTNPVLGQSWDQGDIRTDYNLARNTTMFGRFSQQDTLTLPPSTFGLRTIPGLAVPVGLGNSTTYAGSNNLVAHHAVIAATHIFSSSFIADARFGYGRFNLHALKDGARARGQPGRKTRRKECEPGALLLRAADLLAFELHRNRRAGFDAYDPAGEHLQSEHQFHESSRRAQHQVRHKHRAAPDHRLSDQPGRRAVQFRSDLYLRPEQHRKDRRLDGEFPVGNVVGDQPGFPAGVAGNPNDGDRVLRAGRLEGEQPADIESRVSI